MKNNPKWNDWKWQLSHSIRNINELEEYILPTPSEYYALTHLENFSFSITPFLAEQIKGCEENNPLRKQFIPNYFDTSFCFNSMDYLSEKDFEPVPNLLHKYEDRVAILTTNCCAAYCRHCTRRRLVSQDIGINNLDAAINYIMEHTEITDVLLTGGDPLLLEDKILDDLLNRIISINHVRMIRIGTRIPVSLPMRITIDLIEILKKSKPIYINIHINHSLELSSETKYAISLLADAGFPLGSQSVLLKGINDDADVLQNLFIELLYLRIKPYYIYQCDKIPGCEPFWVSPIMGIKLLNSLNGKLSGLAVPKYVIDTPGQLGKQILAPCNLTSISDNEISMENYRGEKYLLHYE